MILNGYAVYNPENASGDDYSKGKFPAYPAVAEVAADSAQAAELKSTRPHRKPSRTGTPEKLRAARLAQTVGSIQIEPFSHRPTFDRFPKQDFAPNHVIPCDGILCAIERGRVQIRHARDKYMVKTLTIGAVFGEMPEMGQTMLLTEAVAGSSGVTVTTMNPIQAWQWITRNPHWLIKTIGVRLYELEADLYRVEWQRTESRVAALLLKLAGDGGVIEGLSQDKLGEMLGVQREIVASIVTKLRNCGAVSTGLRKITILDKAALNAMSDLCQRPRRCRRGRG
ncbi:MAG: hypothetical protein DMF61_15020 [Blastocatellia bacterium AA13]|nr:MAG: hypothetical protein DMF61_15020 [Blastocatellia bacterium AA13]